MVHLDSRLFASTGVLLIGRLLVRVQSGEQTRIRATEASDIGKSARLVRPRPVRRRRGAELSRPNAQRQQCPDSDRLDPGMCKERRPRATARRWAWHHLGNATEGRRSRSPQMPARSHQRSPRRPVRRVQRGCEGRLLNARAPNLGLSRRERHSYRARSRIGTFNEPRKSDRTCLTGRPLIRVMRVILRV